MMIKLRLTHGALALSLSLVGCADDSATETSGLTSGTTTTDAESESHGSSDETESTGPSEDPFEAWYGTWFWIDSSFAINEQVSKMNGADGLGMTQVDLAPGSLTIRRESCLWGPSRYEYTSRVDEEGALVLDPVDPVSQDFVSEYEMIFVVAGPDCGELRVKGIRVEAGERIEVELLTETSGPLRRGALCLQCPEEDIIPGVISDCGTAVPWACPQ